jgi:hypothetical protein
MLHGRSIVTCCVDGRGPTAAASSLGQLAALDTLPFFFFGLFTAFLGMVV